MRNLYLLLMVLVFMTRPAIAAEAVTIEDPTLANSVLLDIDLTNVTIPVVKSAVSGIHIGSMSSRGVEPSPWIVWRDVLTGLTHAWIMTLDGKTGAQKGRRLDVPLPAVGDIADIRWIRNVTVNFARGVDPVPWIVDKNHKIFWFPVTYGIDGTPEAGDVNWVQLPIDPVTYGYATCMAEIPGTEFDDEKPRLYIGTTEGYVVVVREIYLTGASFDAFVPVSDNAILDMEPIPQFGYISLGVLSNNAIMGYVPDPTTGLVSAYTLSNLRPSGETDFDVFGPDDTPLADPSDSVRLVMADGTTDLALTALGASESGPRDLNLTLDIHVRGIIKIAAGSLLMLADDGSSADYDPAYSPESGSAGCEVNITDEVPDFCGYICGDVNRDLSVNLIDILYLIDYKYGTPSGPAPNPMESGDVNADGNVNLIDILYMIDYKYGAPPGPEPQCPE